MYTILTEIEKWVNGLIKSYLVANDKFTTALLYEITDDYVFISWCDLRQVSWRYWTLSSVFKTGMLVFIFFMDSVLMILFDYFFSSMTTRLKALITCLIW